VTLRGVSGEWQMPKCQTECQMPNAAFGI